MPHEEDDPIGLEPIAGRADGADEAKEVAPAEAAPEAAPAPAPDNEELRGTIFTGNIRTSGRLHQVARNLDVYIKSQETELPDSDTVHRQLVFSGAAQVSVSSGGTATAAIGGATAGPRLLASLPGRFPPWREQWSI